MINAKVLKEEKLEKVNGGKEEYYTIKSGDTLESIAKKYSTTVETLIRWNGFNPQKYVLEPGKTILVKIW